MDKRLEVHDGEATWESLTHAGAGSFRCRHCGFSVALEGPDAAIPECPHCGGSEFRRVGLSRDPGENTFVQRPADEAPEPGWLDGVREKLAQPSGHAPGPGTYLCFDDDDRIRVFPLGEGWTRIGRSLSAHVRFDDPSVSRRHALVYADDAGLRVLDDRSLNGVFVNGQRVEASELEDGDAVQIGRFTLYVLKVVWRGVDTASEMPIEILALPRPDGAWADSIGPVYTAAEWHDRFGSHSEGSLLTRTLVASRVDSDDDSPELVYPAFQFDADGSPYQGAVEVIRLFRRARVSPHAVAAWFTTGQRALEGVTPAQWLKDEHDDSLLIEAAHRSLERLTR